MPHEYHQKSPEELQSILTKTKHFVESRLFGLDHKIMSMPWDDALPILEGLRQEVKALGLWCPQVPSYYGGLGLNNKEHGMVSELLGMSPIGHYTFNCQAPDAGNMEILIEFGTDEQKEKYLFPLLAGKTRSCFSMTEPENAGSNPLYMDTAAIKDGDDYLVTGHKWFTSSADGAAFAIVMAVTNPEHPNPYQRTSQVIVPLDTPGFTLMRNIPIMGEAGAGYYSHAEVSYDACRVPQTNVLGGEGLGFMVAQTRLGPGRIHHCMRWIGICQRAFDMMCRYTMSRTISPGNTLSDKQTIQNWIAESKAEIHAARLMVLDAAEKIDRLGQENAKIEISIIKFYVANVLFKVLDRAIQSHGALGVTDDTLLSWWFRHERGARIYDGADEVHKSRIAKEILKSYASKA